MAAHPGGNVNVVTRSGTNQFHGSVWEFFRNTDLNANSFFDNLDGGGVKQVLNQNQVGGSVGGPIKKDKIFFFVDYQETRQKNGVSAGGSSSVFLFPLPEDRTAANVGAALCPANHPGNPAYNTFVYPIIPSVQMACDGSNISPLSLALMNVKLPNGQLLHSGQSTGQYGPVTYSSPATFTEHQLITNGDYIINSKNTLAVRYFWTADPQFLPLSGTDVPGTPVTSKYNNTNAVMKLTTLLTNSLVNELHVSGQRNGAALVPIPPCYAPVHRPGDHCADHQRAARHSDLQWAQLEWNAGSQQQPHRSDGIWRPDFLVPRASIPFAPAMNIQHAQWPITFEGLERGFLFYGTFADWTLGLPGCQAAGCSLANPGNTNGGGGNILQCLFCVRSGPNGIVHNYVENNQTAFVQDDWKVNSRLTFNLGVRWEYDGSYSRQVRQPDQLLACTDCKLFPFRPPDPQLPVPAWWDTWCPTTTRSTIRRRRRESSVEQQ